MVDLTEGFIGCPFCGAIPEVCNAGSCLDIDCCVSMSFQKSDIIDEKIGRRIPLNMETLRYEDHIEQIIVDYARECWNTRADLV